jgi:hypothetical protein
VRRAKTLDSYELRKIADTLDGINALDSSLQTPEPIEFTRYNDYSFRVRYDEDNAQYVVVL